MRLLTLLAGFAAAAAFSSLPPLERTWEEKVIDAWAAEPDCSPETGMCGACGVAATVVELGENGTQPIVRKYSVGAGGGETPFGSDATFEIASVTKLFTTMLLLVLEEEGLLSSEATIGTYLPCAWDAARHAGTAEITFNELVRHTSGLPAQPPDRGPSVGGNPFSGYTEERLCESLGQLTGLPTRGRYSYSNYAYGTLGYVLTLAYAAVTGSPVRDYEDLLKEKVLDPLGLTATSVTYDDAGWNAAAEGCARGYSRGETTIRRGAYGVLQGNGALRSTQDDMGQFLLAYLVVDAGADAPPELASLFPASLLTAMERALDNVAPACSCTSGWCEGNLCELPNPPQESITVGGVEHYTSGGVDGWRKSGDTGGYSLRVAWSYEKRRAAFAVDTCGGCGERGTSGSSAQRLVLLLADGPPSASVPMDEFSSAEDTIAAYKFVGEAQSHIYPSVTLIELNLDTGSDPLAYVASSDGAGGTTSAVLTAEGVYELQGPLFYGTGWQGDDPLAALQQSRSVRISADEQSALFQDMGGDVLLTAAV